MAEVVGNINSTFVEVFQNFSNILPLWAQNFINLFFLSLLMVVYAILIWKFYRWISKKDLIELNLRKYNRYENPFMEKIMAAMLYFLEYLVILPFMVFVWFSFFTIFLMLLTENLELKTILVISVTVVAAIRMTAYYKEDLARDLAKMLPLTLLAVAITQGIISFEKILNQIMALPEFFSHIWTYLLFIVIIEFILRLVDVLFTSFNIYEEKSVTTDK